MGGLLFIVLFFIVFINVIKKAFDSDYSSGGTYKSYERYIEDDRENYRDAKSLPQSERTRWYGNSHNTGPGTVNATTGAKEASRPGASGRPETADMKDPFDIPGRAGAQSANAGQDVTGMQGADARPDTAEKQIMAGTQYAPDVSDTAGIRNVPLRSEADDMANTADIPHIMSDPAKYDYIEVYSGSGADKRSLPDQSDGVAGSEAATDTWYGFEIDRSSPADYYGDFSITAGMECTDNTANDRLAGTNAPAWTQSWQPGNEKSEESAKGYFTTDLKAFEYTDVAVDSRIDLDAVMPQVRTDVKTDGPVDPETAGTAGGTGMP